MTLAILALVGFFCFSGTFLAGVQYQAAVVVGGDTPALALPPTLAAWCLLTTGTVLVGAHRIRKAPISVYRRNAAPLPVSDRYLISPWTSNLLEMAVPLTLISASAFAVVAIAVEADFVLFLRVALMVGMTCIFTWVLAELVAIFLPLSPLVEATLILVHLSVFLLIVAGCVISRDINEVVREESYGPIWSLPPGGWLIGVCGLLKPNSLRDWLLPMVACVACGLAWLKVRKTFELRDIQIAGGSRITAWRAEWIRSWQRPQPVSSYAQLTTTLERAEVRCRERRTFLLGKQAVSLFHRWLMPYRPAAKQLACLGLLGLRYPKRGSLADFAWGLWPVPFAVGSLILNQYATLIAFPKFLRLPLILAFAMSLVDFREFGAATEKGETTLGFTICRSVFPLSLWDILRYLLMNRLLGLWCVLPGWAVAICLLSLTDMPSHMVLQIPPLLMGMSLLLPFLSTVMYGTGNLRSCWQAWVLCLIPWMLFVILAAVGIQVGVISYVLSMRTDAAWFWLGVISISTLAVCLTFAKFLSNGTFDESVVQLNRTMMKLNQ